MDHVHHTPPHAPACRCPSCINEAIRRLAASVVEWTPQAQAELDVLYRRWQAAREVADADEDEPAAA
jgi:hypothetical protein